jgi:hypothetical protein
MLTISDRRPRPQGLRPMSHLPMSLVSMSLPRKFHNTSSRHFKTEEKLLGLHYYPILPKGPNTHHTSVPSTQRRLASKQSTPICDMQHTTKLQICHSITDPRPNDMHILHDHRFTNQRLLRHFNLLKYYALFFDTHLWLRHMLQGRWCWRPHLSSLPLASNTI